MGERRYALLEEREYLWVIEWNDGRYLKICRCNSEYSAERVIDALSKMDEDVFEARPDD